MSDVGELPPVMKTSYNKKVVNYYQTQKKQKQKALKKCFKVSSIFASSDGNCKENKNDDKDIGHFDDNTGAS